MTTLVLRFKMEDSQPENAVKFECVSPSQLSRDMSRLQDKASFKGKSRCDEVKPTDGHHEMSDESQENKQPDTDKMDIEVFAPEVSKGLHVKPKVLSPRITRSKRHATNQAKPSPVPQVDGHVESPPSSQSAEDWLYDGSKDWEKTLLQWSKAQMIKANILSPSRLDSGQD